MKRKYLACLAALFCFVPAGLAIWAHVSLKELLKETDLIVVARLTNVSEVTTNRVDYGSGTLTVTEVIRGSAKTGDKLRLEWSNSSGIVCPRVEHRGHKDQTLIWLLQASTNKVVTADYPGRVLELKQRAELNKLLKKEKKK
ncbi:MAG: hypothetical protein QM813_22700 [Verrucomicrobiota bacterium]